MYGMIKDTVLGWYPVGGEARLILFGFSLLLVTTAVFRLRLSQWWAAGVVLAVAAIMELLDVILLGQSITLGLRHLLVVAVPPAILVLFIRQGWSKA
ncbi:MAG: hypothetical protein K9H25_04975 [Rhodospirillum sp.]|nr:hypothetical protein [Rhodospirillum sp.]MCF8490489.1 hypothetical protein [Rhodospirillum sp.]MCF8500095.1 hypothetical protein [Rhodospirillum sp.]